MSAAMAPPPGASHFPIRPMPVGRAPATRSATSGWGAVALFAVMWAFVPMLPAFVHGAIAGSPWTDLYPSVWGLGWFAEHQPGLPTFATALAAPAGMPFYYSSPIHGWLGAPLYALGGAAFAWNTTLLLARIATILCAYGAFRASGLGPAGGLAAAAIYGASPFFHGYSVEGIVEGTDGWTLPLWVWCVLRGRRIAGSVAFALVIVSSWYLGMVACLLAAGWGLWRRDAWITAAPGFALASPFLWAFTHAFSGATPLMDDIRAAMGAPLGAHQPGILAGNNPFAITTWIGLSIPLLALPQAPKRPGLFAAAVVCAILSLGRGPWYHLPVLASVRFPYRWHAGTLFCLAPLAGLTVDRLGRRWIALIPVIEAVIFSPIEPLIPQAPADVPALYDAVRGPTLLEVPGPVAMPPGEVNRSRPRAKYLLYWQLHHGAASPWAPDFNGVGAAKDAPWLASWASWDPLLREAPTPPDVGSAKAAGVTQVMVHRDELRSNAAPFEHALVTAGARLHGEEGTIALYDL
jgi:hypothetical protein